MNTTLSAQEAARVAACLRSAARAYESAAAAYSVDPLTGEFHAQRQTTLEMADDARMLADRMPDVAASLCALQDAASLVLKSNWIGTGEASIVVSRAGYDALRGL